MSTSDPRAWLWAEAFEMLEQADRLHRQFFRLAGRTQQQVRWEPPADMVDESNGDLLIAVALPGVPPERVMVDFTDGGLIVTADRPRPLSDRTTVIRRLEIPYGRFERRLTLPAGRYELIEQACQHGCLMLRLRRL